MPIDGMGDLPSAVLIDASGSRKRILQMGEQGLSDVECLALVLRAGRGFESAEQLAQMLLRQFGGLAGLSLRSIRELARDGVGSVRASAVLAAFGLARRLSLEAFRPGALVRHGGDVAQVVRHAAHGMRRESFFVVLLDVRSRIMGLHQVSVGVVDSAPVHPREVFGPAVRDAAVAVVVAHNHPSGDPSPSRQDHEVTERLKSAGVLLGIEVLDHVVVGIDQYYSFADKSFFGYG